MDLHADKVITSRAVQLLPKETLKALVARDTFMVDEIQIFEAVRKWIERHDVERESAGDLLECVRLSEIPRTQLKMVVLPTGLYPRARVLEAMGERVVAEGSGECLATRGRTGDRIKHMYIILAKSYKPIPNTHTPHNRQRY